MAGGRSVRRLSVGVVGCGRNSDNHLRVYASTEGVRLLAVCDVDSVKAEQKAQRYGAERVLTEFDSMLDLDLDLVDVVTPTPTHARLSELALEAGHNVLVEKPMAVSSAECMSMIRAAERSGRTLCVMHNKRFFDCILRTRGTIDREGLSVSRIRVSHFFPYGHLRPAWPMTEEAGGILWEALVHHVYVVQHFLGEVESVSAVARRVRRPVWDSITLVLRCRGGVGVCEFEYDVMEPLEVFQLTTEEGDRFDGDFINDLVVRRSRSYRARGAPSFFERLSDDLYVPFVKRTQGLRRLMEMPSSGSVTPFTKTFFVLIRQYLSFLAGERASPPVAPQEGLKAIRVLEASRRAIDTGRTQSPT